ncbi:MAG: ammonium transporter, partial [Leptolyngbyaceae cyanobacterium SL_5_14]|nr:ammonium transporter [Leptolyngbyaceae cyanobacterium SL_5_14]
MPPNRQVNLSNPATLFEQITAGVKQLSPSWQACIPLACILVLICAFGATAQDISPEEAVAELRVGLDTLWVVIAAILVIFMNAGFCMLETGFCRQKNAVNVLSKNLIVFA